MSQELGYACSSAIPGPSYSQAEDTYLVNHSPATSSVLAPWALQNDALIARFSAILANHFRAFVPGYAVAMSRCAGFLNVPN
jgi:hypothetical protein